MKIILKTAIEKKLKIIIIQASLKNANDKSFYVPVLFLGALLSLSSHAYEKKILNDNYHSRTTVTITL